MAAATQRRQPSVRHARRQPEDLAAEGPAGLAESGPSRGAGPLHRPDRGNRAALRGGRHPARRPLRLAGGTRVRRLHPGALQGRDRPGASRRLHRPLLDEVAAPAAHLPAAGAAGHPAGGGRPPPHRDQPLPRALPLRLQPLAAGLGDLGRRFPGGRPDRAELRLFGEGVCQGPQPARAGEGPQLGHAGGDRHPGGLRRTHHRHGQPRTEGAAGRRPRPRRDLSSTGKGSGECMRDGRGERPGWPPSAASTAPSSGPTVSRPPRAASGTGPPLPWCWRKAPRPPDAPGPPASAPAGRGHSSASG